MISARFHVEKGRLPAFHIDFPFRKSRLCDADRQLESIRK